MGRSSTIKFARIAILLVVCSIPRSCGIDSRNPIGGATTAAGTADGDIRKILRTISTGTWSASEDEHLVKLIREEIARTAQSIKKPSGSIGAAARRAQKLVTELTFAYTSAIYKSKSAEEARINFGRFQDTVKKIVDSIKNGQLVV